MQLSGIAAHVSGLRTTDALRPHVGADELVPSRQDDSAVDGHEPRAGSLGGAHETDESPGDERRLGELRRRDREVRAHEQAHKAAAGAHARGGPSYEYELGPDHRRYAVGGEVAIDVSEVSGDDQATITKMQQVRRAALAPANPSAADRQIAAQASRQEAQARRRLRDSSGTSGDDGRLSYGELSHELTGQFVSRTV